jgi:putative hemolysin
MGVGNRMNIQTRVPMELETGRFLVKTITTETELRQAFALRFQVFQVEMVGSLETQGFDHDEYDLVSDHLGIFDLKSGFMIATCRLNCSLFSNHFYTASEFQCTSLLSRNETKLEIGRVCVHPDFRRGIILILLWRAIAEYMGRTESKVLFGCSSVMTENVHDAALLYRYLRDEGKVRPDPFIRPSEKYHSQEFDVLVSNNIQKLTENERVFAKMALPALCRSYFDIGCYVASPPAFDKSFKCIDFLTVLESDELNARVKRKMVGLEA